MTSFNHKLSQVVPWVLGEQPRRVWLSTAENGIIHAMYNAISHFRAHPRSLALCFAAQGKNVVGELLNF